MADPIRTALYAKLTGDATLMALTADGDAYHDRAPQDARTPLITFAKQAGTPVWSNAGQPFRNQLWLVKGIDRGDSASTAEDIDARIATILNDAALSITGFTHMYLRRESDVDYAEDDGAETYHHVGAIYRLYADPT